MSAAAAMRLTRLHGEPRSALVWPAHARRRHGGAGTPMAFMPDCDVVVIRGLVWEEA